MPNTPQHTAWVDVDTAAIRHNYRQVKAFVGDATRVMAVIKTNAYGHGLELTARALQTDTDAFGVSTAEEGARLRAAGVDTPALVFQPCGPWNADALVENALTATVDSEAGASALEAAGRARGVQPRAHLKIDTGMSRFGVFHADAEALTRLLARPGIAWTGAFTHLATASDQSPRAAEAQWRAFLAATAPFASAGLLLHALNSAGLLRFPERGGMVRTGTLLYGQYPSAHVPRALDLRPTWTFRTRIVSLRRVEAGAAVGYGGEWVARRPSVIATIPVGYFDGFTVEPRSVWKRQGGIKGLIKRVRGRDRVRVKTPHGAAPVVGRVAAQSAMLDVTDLPKIALGDVVELPARRVLVGEHIPRVDLAG